MTMHFCTGCAGGTPWCPCSHTCPPPAGLAADIARHEAIADLLAEGIADPLDGQWDEYITQRIEDTMLQPSRHDDEHGSTSDYWDDYPMPTDADIIAADGLVFILTDVELGELSEDVDAIPPDQWDLIDLTPPF